ncbi:protein grindelwald [Bacillus rossius redtenbacheri]|uniref:protein grindelwald n=1 Tax=Bacillus rossius redtenbacheri TaxID=93214 RepID=UPI002FDDA618
MRRRLVLALLALAAAAAAAAAAGVDVAAPGGLGVAAKKCRERSCPADNYCSEFESVCKPCADICETASHNFQELTCVRDCQDYIHDRRYASKNDINKLYVMVIICFVLLGTILAALVGGLLFWFLRCRTDKILFCHFKKKEASQNNNKGAEEGARGGYNKSEALKLEMPAPAATSAAGSVSPSYAGPVSPTTTSTPLSRNRHPSEDATLDYAYDNPVMTPSPVLEQQNVSGGHQNRESSF